jgi:hypothetical protein
MLRNVEVAAEIQRLMDLRAERTQVHADHVVRELARVAFSNIADVAA